MKNIRTILSIIALTIFVSACSAPATPTAIDIVSIQNTSVAAALTIIAETQAAIPTSTPLPTETPTETPTQTPLPTETPAVTETSTVIALATSAGGTDPCDAQLPPGLLGRPTKIKLENATGAPINVSVYMNLTPFGQCGYKGYSIGKGGAPVITDLPQACYNVFVWINDPKKPTTSSGYGCINNPDQWTFVIKRDSVSFQGR